MNAEYNGDQKPGSGRRPELKKDAFQIQLVIDGMQNGLGHSGTHLLVNEFREQNGQEPVGKSAIAGMVKRLNPKVDDVTRRKQGSMDSESAWAIARTNWVMQLLVTFGKICNNQITAENKYCKTYLSSLFTKLHAGMKCIRSKLLG